MSPRRQHSGPEAIAQALDTGEPLRLVLVRDGGLSPPARDALARCQAAGIPVRKASAREMKRMAALPDAEIAALAGPAPDAGLDDVLAAGGALWLLTGIAYPGNAGFAIRTVEVAGAAGIALDASFDHAGRRQALRASMRADRFFPVLWARAGDVLERARASGHRLLAVEDRGTRAPWEADLTGDAVFVVGGEAGGIAAPLLDACDDTLRIPMTGFIPSYNLQAAVAIVAGERLRQLQV